MRVYDDISPSMLEELCLKFLSVDGGDDPIEMHAKQLAEKIWLFDDNLITCGMRVERTRNALERLERKKLITSELVRVQRNNTRRYYKRVK